MRIADIVVELNAAGSGYPIDTVYKPIQRLTTFPGANRLPTGVERANRHRLMFSSNAA